MYMPVHISVHHMHTVSMEFRKRVSDPPRPRVTDSREPSCGCWELNLGPLQEQQVLFTAELSLKVLFFNFGKVCTILTRRAAEGNARKDVQILSLWISNQHTKISSLGVLGI